MSTTIIEPDTTPVTESNISASEVQNAEPTNTEEVRQTETVEQPTQQVESQPEEPTVELDGENVPLSQVKKWKEDYANDLKWKDKNRRESEELNKTREGLKELELLKPLIEQRKDEILPLLFSQPKAEDFDAKLEAHYQKTLPVDPSTGQPTDESVRRWNLEKDKLVAERAVSLAQKQAREEMRQTEARQYHDLLLDEAHKKYVQSDKLTESEFTELVRYAGENIALRGGKLPREAFDIAYKLKYEERWLSEMKVNDAKKAVEPIFKAQKTASEPGKKLPSTLPKTPQDKEDDEFVKRAKSRNPNYIKL